MLKTELEQLVKELQEENDKLKERLKTPKAGGGVDMSFLKDRLEWNRYYGRWEVHLTREEKEKLF